MKLLLFVPGTLWGISFSVNEVLLETVPPITIVLARSFLALAPLSLALWWRGGRLPQSWQEWWPFVVLGALNNTIPFLLITWAQLTLASSLATILTSLMPLFTLLIAVKLGDERLDRPKTIGILIGLVGVIILIGPAALGGLGRNLISQLAIIVGTIAYAMAAVYSRRVLTQWNRGSIIDAILTLTVSQYITSSLTLIPLFLLIDRPWTLQPDSSTVIGMLVLAWPITAGAVTIYYLLIDQMGASVGAMTVYLIPIVGVLVGVFALGEELAWQTIVALLLILLGIALVNGVRLPQKPIAIES